MVTCFEAPPDFVPANLSADQLREINALTHVENELIDEACGRVWDAIAKRGWADDTDVLYTTDHGELQGDFGLLFKGPYHVDALMRLPFIWKPAKSTARRPPSSINRSASSISHRPSAPSPASTCRSDAGQAIAGERDAGRGPEARARHHRVGQRVQGHQPASAHDLPRRAGLYRLQKSSLYDGDGSVGELYDCANDPLQRRISGTSRPGRRARRT